MKVHALMYHDVVEAGTDDASGFPGRAAARYKLTWPELETHLEAIAGAGAAPVLLHRFERPGRTGSRVLLTFDDGGASALRTGERLTAMGWPGYFFVATDYIGRPAFLDAGGIRALRAMGHVIGSHSSSHPARMSRCGWDELVREWGESTSLLSELLDERVAVASVPGGYYSTQVAKAAAEAGIEVLFTSEPRATPWLVDGCLVLGRYSITRDTPAATAGRLAAGKAAPRLRQATSWNVKKAAKALPGDPYSKVRTAILKRR